MPMAVHRFLFIRRAAVLLPMLLCFALAACAHGTTARILGEVTDATGAVLPKARITSSSGERQLQFALKPVW